MVLLCLTKDTDFVDEGLACRKSSKVNSLIKRPSSSVQPSGLATKSAPKMGVVVALGFLLDLFVQLGAALHVLSLKGKQFFIIDVSRAVWATRTILTMTSLEMNSQRPSSVRISKLVFLRKLIVLDKCILGVGKGLNIQVNFNKVVPF